MMVKSTGRASHKPRLNLAVLFADCVILGKLLNSPCALVSAPGSKSAHMGPSH